MEDSPLHGYVIDRVQISDHSFVLTLFTREIGTCKGVWRAGQGRRYSLAAVEPLRRVCVKLSGRQHRDLKRVQFLESDQSATPARSDYRGLACAQHWSQLIGRLQPEHAPDDRVFRLLEHAVDCLVGLKGRRELALANLYFEYWMWWLSGFGIRMDDPDQLVGRSSDGSLRYGAMLLSGASVELQRRDIEVLGAATKQRIEEFAALAIEWGSLTRLAAFFGSMWQHHLPSKLLARPILIDLLIERTES